MKQQLLRLMAPEMFMLHWCSTNPDDGSYDYVTIQYDPAGARNMGPSL